MRAPGRLNKDFGVVHVDVPADVINSAKSHVGIHGADSLHVYRQTGG